MDEQDRLLKPRKIFHLGLFFWEHALIPTHSYMVQLKIEKIKNEAITKENLDKGLETIERVASKLECKYLGCEKKK